jgi:hypothetical protein
LILNFRFAVAGRKKSVKKGKLLPCNCFFDRRIQLILLRANVSTIAQNSQRKEEEVNVR